MPNTRAKNAANGRITIPDAVTSSTMPRCMWKIVRVNAGKTFHAHRMLGVVLNQSEDVLDETHYNYGYYGNNRQPKE